MKSRPWETAMPIRHEDEMALTQLAVDLNRAVGKGDADAVAATVDRARAIWGAVKERFPHLAHPASAAPQDIIEASLTAAEQLGRMGDAAKVYGAIPATYGPQPVGSDSLGPWPTTKQPQRSSEDLPSSSLSWWLR